MGYRPVIKGHKLEAHRYNVCTANIVPVLIIDCCITTELKMQWLTQQFIFELSHGSVIDLGSNG